MAIAISDDSEFQGVVNPVGQEIIILRAYNGYRKDIDFAASRANAQRDGCAAVGIYAYLVASRDAAQQAQELLAVIGKLAPNEWLICDLEEGGGNEQPRWLAWRLVVMAATGRAPWLYSGLSFAQSTNLQPDWVAAYQGNEPVTSYHHKLWQNSDNYPYPWARTDSSVYDGTLAQFLADTGITNVPIIQPRKLNFLLLQECA